MRILLLLIPNLALALDTYIDIDYESGQETTPIVLTVDPKLIVKRFQDYIFRAYGLDPRKYELLVDN